jgi:hypothetical protein
MIDAHFPEDVRGIFADARMPNGELVMNNPDVMRGMINMALDLNPARVVVPAGGGEPVDGINEEIASIEKTMRENNRAYVKDEKMQARYRELLDAREKMSKRTGT